ncbi:MAG TPA: ATP-binding cassette domain-containing protein [Herpetosiphonaceae bacterium]
MEPLYHLQHVTKRYGARTVLAIDDLTIEAGERLALIGPSGAGKSTLLRLLCFLEPLTSGRLACDGQAYKDTIPLAVQREITLVFQRPLLLDTSVWQNVAFGLRVRGQRDDRRVAALLELLGLEQVAHARALTLSGGEMQRVALARALVFRPRVLLLDEPTANLDPRNVALMEAAITALHCEHGSTIVVATHNLHQARRLTARAVMLLDGQMIEQGPTERLLTVATDQRTSAFVKGEMIY